MSNSKIIYQLFQFELVPHSHFREICLSDFKTFLDNIIKYLNTLGISGWEPINFPTTMEIFELYNLFSNNDFRNEEISIKFICKHYND